jgi:hypothetical protein
VDEWEAMFREVQGITRQALPLQQSLQQVVAFARNNPALFDAVEYWESALEHDFRPAFATTTEWAVEGLEALAPKSGWEFLLLDLGDCPEIFRLYSPGGQGLMSEQRLRAVLGGELIIGTSDLEGCYGPEVADPFGQLFGDGIEELGGGHVSELRDTVLDWTGGGDDQDDATDFHGNSGYLLWLMLGTLALVEPLRDGAFCQSILRGRERLYLLSGYEEIFFHVATVTPSGISYTGA